MLFRYQQAWTPINFCANGVYNPRTHIDLSANVSQGTKSHQRGIILQCASHETDQGITE